MEKRGKHNRFKNVSMDRLLFLKNKLEVELLAVGISDTRISELDRIDEEIERRKDERYKWQKD